MNKHVITLSFLLGSIIYAQGEESKIRFNVFTNPCIVWFNSDVKSTRSESVIFGFDVGFNMDRYFANHYAYTLGASITRFGGTLSYTYDQTYSTSEDAVIVPANTLIKHQLQYLSIPVGLKFTSREIGYTTIYAHLGLSAHFNIKSTASSEGMQVLLDKDNISKDISFFHISYYFGGGIQYSLGGNTALFLGLTFLNGLNDVTKFQRDKITNLALALRLGLQF